MVTKEGTSYQFVPASDGRNDMIIDKSTDGKCFGSKMIDIMIVFGVDTCHSTVGVQMN